MPSRNVADELRFKVERVTEIPISDIENDEVFDNIFNLFLFSWVYFWMKIKKKKKNGNGAKIKCTQVCEVISPMEEHTWGDWQQIAK